MRILTIALTLLTGIACNLRHHAGRPFDELEMVIMNRPDHAAIIGRFATKAPSDSVWKAISSASGLTNWAADSAVVELSGGGRYFRFNKSGSYRQCTVQSFITGKKLTYEDAINGTWASWQIEKLPKGGSFVTVAFNGVSASWREQLQSKKDTCSRELQNLIRYLSVSGN